MNTVTEAIALGTLLRWITQKPHNGIEVPTSEEARDAAALLAEKARRTGACGFSTDQINKLWPQPEPPVTLMADDTRARAAIAFDTLQVQLNRCLGVPDLTIFPHFYSLPPAVQQVWIGVIAALDAYDAERVELFATQTNGRLRVAFANA